MAVIETEGLTKIYSSWFGFRKVPALEDLTLNVRENTVFGFLGPNGAGKTTTLKLLLGLIMPSCGSGKVLGKPLGERAVRERIGFLPDSPSFYPHLSAKDFLYYCAKLLHMPYARYVPRVDELLSRMGLADSAGRKLSEFSRGMLQRVGIAQALLGDPELIILDEPVTGLDPKGRVEIRAIVEELKGEGKSVFFSSHILADVEAMCDEIGILNRGRLVCCGPVVELLAEKDVVVWVGGIEGEDFDKAEAMCSSVTKKKDLWGFQLQSPSKKEDFFAFVKGAGGTVDSVESTQEDLETFFLSTIEADDAKAREREAPVEPAIAGKER